MESKNELSEPDQCHPDKNNSYCWGSSSHAFLLQAMIVCAVLCLPGNIVTYVMYTRVADSASKDLVTSGHNLSLQANLTQPLQITQNASEAPENTNLSCSDDFSLETLFNYCQHLCFEKDEEKLTGCFTTSIQKLHSPQREEYEACIDSLSAFQAMCLALALEGVKGYERKRMEEVNLNQGNLDGVSSLHNGSVPIFTYNINDTSVMETAADHNECHESFEDHRHIMTNAQFWIEGVTLLIVGIMGIVGNCMTIVVLRRIESNMTFNRLLMMLAIADTLLLLYYILDYGILGTFYRSNDDSYEPYWYRISFPYLHPFKSFCLSSSIFMVVAVSVERHKAISSPLTHRPSFWPYAITVLFVSGATNIPKFFEFELYTDSENITDYTTTLLNEDPAYITFSSWWDGLVITGIIPLASLVFFNVRIYLKMRASSRQKYRFAGKRISARNKQISQLVDSRKRLSSQTETEFIECATERRHARSRRFRRTFNGVSTRERPFIISPPPRTPPRILNGVLTRESPITTSLSLEDEINQDIEVQSSSKSKAVNPNWMRFNKELFPIQSTSSDRSSRPHHGHKTQQKQCEMQDLSHCRRHSRVRDSKKAVALRKPSMFLKHEETKDIDQQVFSSRTQRSTRILVSIVLVFLLCHMLRLFIQAYEVMHPRDSTLDLFDYCQQRGRFHIPVGFYVMLSVSHLFLVINSSINFIIYCCVGRRFRAELRNVFVSESN